MGRLPSEAMDLQALLASCYYRFMTACSLPNCAQHHYTQQVDFAQLKSELQEESRFARMSSGEGFSADVLEDAIASFLEEKKKNGAKHVDGNGDALETYDDTALRETMNRLLAG